MSVELDLFGNEVSTETRYTTKVETPTYEPKARQPHILELVDRGKCDRLIQKIESSGVSDAEKKFLIEAAHRHSVFWYDKIADYYAHASDEMKSLMEASALVIIDYDDALKNGFVKLQKSIESIARR